MPKKLYRVVVPASIGQRRFEPGEVVMLGLSKEIERIALEGGTLEHVHSPPIQVIAGWKDRGEFLAQVARIETVADLLMADSATVAKKTGATKGDIDEMKQALKKFLV